MKTIPVINCICGKTQEGQESAYLQLVMPNGDKYLDEQLIRENIHMGSTVIKQITRKHGGKLNDNFTIIFSSNENGMKCAEEINKFIKSRK